MLQAMNSLSGKLSNESLKDLSGHLNNPIEYIYPELEDLTITPSTEQQTFKSNKYGYDNVTVNAVKGKVLEITPTMEEQKFNGLYDTVNVKAIESEELSIVPSATEQTYEGLYKKVTVAGDSDLIAENIKEGAEIFGVEGKAKSVNAKITNALYLFYSNTRLDYLEELLQLCENVTSTVSMFYTCDKLTDLDLSNFDASKVTSTSSMFYSCLLLANLNLSNFNTVNVKTMPYMFYNCKKLTNLDLSSFNTSNVTDMSSMFYGCSELTNLDLSNFNTSNVRNMGNMFYNCTKLVNFNLSNFDISNVTNMSSMFGNCTYLTDLDLSSFSANNVTNMQTMFYSCSKLTDLDLSNFDASKVTSISNAFSGCRKLANFKGLKNLGKGYTQKSNKYSNYTLTLSPCTLLTHESLMSVINNLYDLNLTYNVANGGKLYTQSLTLGATNLAKLTAEEIAIATNKRLDGFIERRTKMQFFDYTKPKMMVAEKGKHIRAKNDVYVAEHIDENGLLVEEHVPYYSTTIFVPDSFTEEQMNELYVEENIT